MDSVSLFIWCCIVLTWRFTRNHHLMVVMFINPRHLLKGSFLSYAYLTFVYHLELLSGRGSVNRHTPVWYLRSYKHVQWLIFCFLFHLLFLSSLFILHLVPWRFDFYFGDSNDFRYWKVELWKNFFVKLLNSNPGCNNKKLLQNLRESFQEYICSDPHLLKKLSDLLAKQRKSMCSA